MQQDLRLLILKWWQYKVVLIVIKNGARTVHHFYIVNNYTIDIKLLLKMFKPEACSYTKCRKTDCNVAISIIGNSTRENNIVSLK